MTKSEKWRLRAIGAVLAAIAGAFLAVLQHEWHLSDRQVFVLFIWTAFVVAMVFPLGLVIGVVIEEERSE